MVRLEGLLGDVHAMARDIPGSDAIELGLDSSDKFPVGSVVVVWVACLSAGRARVVAERPIRLEWMGGVGEIDEVAS